MAAGFARWVAAAAVATAAAVAAAAVPPAAADEVHVRSVSSVRLPLASTLGVNVRVFGRDRVDATRRLRAARAALEAGVAAVPGLPAGAVSRDRNEVTRNYRKCVLGGVGWGGWGGGDAGGAWCGVSTTGVPDRGVPPARYGRGPCSGLPGGRPPAARHRH